MNSFHSETTTRNGIVELEPFLDPVRNFDGQAQMMGGYV